MAKHTIKKEEIEAWMAQEVWHKGAASYGSGSSKSLDVSNSDVFRVIDHGVIVYEGTDVAAAVDAYNSAR